ncbi:MAG: flagellar M-ring protein FliF [Treponema sp.]|jgi:flagellar M-ring protein FliF|nr:flagellar M-ring protein FliF [Treponema sp.]
MNEFIKKLLTHIGGLWGKWSMIQRIILIGIAAAVIGGIVALFGVSSAPTMVSVIDAPIRDEAALDRIVLRINQEGIKTSVTATGMVQVADETTARRMRAILIREDLIPSGTDPWQIFDRDRWTITDFERNVNLRRAITQMITDHIKALDDVDDANVTIVFPEKELFRSDQNPVTASVIIIPKPGSDITANRKKVEGIQKTLRLAVEGLKDENIVITDKSGNILNNFADLAEFDRMRSIEQQAKFVREQETKLRVQVLTFLQQTFTTDRVRDLNLKIDMDLSKETVNIKEFFPITKKPRTPGLPYDDSELLDYIPRSSSTSDTKWEGRGFNPQGPTGVEGHTPPAIIDMDNVYGTMTQLTDVHNNEINEKVTAKERSPQIDRITVSVNIDGTWNWKYDEKKNPVILPNGSIEREYIPVPPEQLRAAQLIVQNAVGYNSARGDSVTVQNIPFDRSAQFKEEDAAYFRKKQVQTTIVIFISGLTLLLIAFIIVRTIQRELERRRRLAEEERARREQALRESAMAEAEQEGVDVSISVEERTRMELMESVVNMAKEHPEDCAQLIRTWLLED